MEQEPMPFSIKKEKFSSVISEYGFNCNQIEGTSFSCGFCDDKFTNRLKIAMHYVLNHQLRYCSVCTILFANDYDKEIHETTIHYPLKCSNCMQEFNDTLKLKDHYVNEHSTKLCDFCPTLIQPIDQYKVHLTKRHAVQDIEELEKTNEIFKIDSNKLTYLCFMCLKAKKLTEIFGHYVFYHNISINSVLEYTTKYSDILKIDGATSKPINISFMNEVTKGVIQLTTETDVCAICQKAFSDNVPKRMHDIFCKGFLLCIECDNVFSDPETLNEHTDNKHKDIPCKFGCELKLKLDDIQSHIQLIHDITDCILCGLVTSSCSNKLNSHLKEKHNVDLQIYEKCENKNKLYRIEGRKSKKVLCNFCNNDITQTMNDICNLFLHYESVHGCNKNAMIRKLEKNPILDLIVQNTSTPKISIENKQTIDYLKYFQQITFCETENDNALNDKGNLQFDTNLIFCVASDTSDDEDYNLTDDYNDDQPIAENITKRPKFVNKSDGYSSTEEIEDTVFLKENNIKKQNKNIKKFTEFCQFCDIKSIKTLRSLFVHMQKIHGFELKNYEPHCSLCNVEFSSVHCLERHNKRKHTSQNKKGIYECPFCKIEATSKGAIRKHVKEHSEEVSTITCSLESIGFKCRYCFDLFWSSEQRNNHHLQNHSNENGEEIMICYICDKLFSSKSCLRRHLSEEHEEKAGNIVYKCSLCKITYTNMESVSTHMKKVHPEKKSLFCSVKSCKMRIENSKDIERHYNKFHSKSSTAYKETILKCTICGKSFKNKTTAINHYLNSHENKKQKVRGFKCRLCIMEFRTSDDRKLHCLTDHEGEKVFKCSTCSKGFSNKSGLYTHIQIHSTLHQKSCPFCGKIFNRKDSYNEHLLIHQGPQHQCSYCPKTFVQRSNLIRHQRIHTGEKPYKCLYCDKVFSDRGACSSHERVHTREEVSSCPYCNKSFSKKQKLRYHIRFHTKENLQTCDICSKVFTNSHSLKVHKMIHDRVNNIPCKQCPKTFSNEKYMKRHLTAVHIKNSEFACHICNKNFGNRSQMREHLMTHGSGKHISCLLCDFQCSSAKYARSHLIKIHGIDKEQTPLRNFIYIKTPEEEGILPSTSSTNNVNNSINKDSSNNNFIEELENINVDDNNMEDETLTIETYLQPEVILENSDN